LLGLPEDFDTGVLVGIELHELRFAPYRLDLMREGSRTARL
jgi:hypothetical protein